MAGSPKTGDLEVGQRIVARREELGLSRRALAEATDLSYPYVAQIETGYRMPSSRHQATLARALGLTLDELFGFDGAGEVEPPRRRDIRRRPERERDYRPLEPDRNAARQRGPSTAEAIDIAAEALEALPASVRLEALSRLQLRIVTGVAQEEARRRGGR